MVTHRVPTVVREASGHQRGRKERSEKGGKAEVTGTTVRNMVVAGDENGIG